MDQWIIFLFYGNLSERKERTYTPLFGKCQNTLNHDYFYRLEAPLLIRPFLDGMTESELHAVMTGGFATIAGSVLGAYISFGVSPSHLLSASVMSAPAALAMSKLMYPETDEPAIKDVEDITIEKT